MSLVGRKRKQLIDTEQATIDSLLKEILLELQAIRVVLIEAYEPMEDDKHG